MAQSSARVTQEREALVRELCALDGPARTLALKRFAALPMKDAASLLEALWQEQTPSGDHAVLDALATLQFQGAAHEFSTHWQRLAKHADLHLRSEGLEAAARVPGAAAAACLANWCDDTDPALRVHAFTRLLVLNQPAAGCAAKGLGDTEAAVRMQAARLAARFPDPACVPGLQAAAQVADPRLVAAALDALNRHHPLLSVGSALLLQKSGQPELALEALKVLRPLAGTALSRAILDGIASYPADWPPPQPAALILLLEQLPDRARDRFARSMEPHWLLRALLESEQRQPVGSPGAIQRLTRLTHASDPALRAAAVQALERHDAAEPGAALSPLLAHPQTDVRELAIRGLGRAGPKALALLRRFLSDEDTDLRRAAYVALANLLPDESAGVWARGSRDTDPALRRWATGQLTALPDGDAPRRALVAAARDSDPQTRALAVQALVAREIALPSLAREYRDTLADAVAAKEDPDTVSLTPPQLAELARIVATLKPYNHLAVLVQAARHRSAVVRRAAADAILASQGSKQAREAMAMLSATDDPDILKRVALTLAANGDPRGLLPLLRALDECPGSREALEPLLAHYPQARQLKFLLRSLKQPWPSIKRFALRGLLELDSPEMIEPLLQATKDPDPDVQRGALQALARFAKHPQVYQRLMEIRDVGGDEHLRQEAVATLLGMDSPSVIQPLLEATHEEDVEVQFGAVAALGRFASKPEVVKRLLELVEFGDVAVREKAIQVLGENKVKEAVEGLIRFIGNPFLGGRAQEALFAIGDRKGILAIKRHKLRARLFGKKKQKGAVSSLGKRNKDRGPRRQTRGNARRI